MDEELKKLELLKEREDINEEVLASVIKRIKMIKDKAEVKK